MVGRALPVQRLYRARRADVVAYRWIVFGVRFIHNVTPRSGLGDISAGRAGASHSAIEFDRIQRMHASRAGRHLDSIFHGTILPTRLARRPENPRLPTGLSHVEQQGLRPRLRRRPFQPMALTVTPPRSGLVPDCLSGSRRALQAYPTAQFAGGKIRTHSDRTITSLSGPDSCN
jgi:hypothetical protein